MPLTLRSEVYHLAFQFLLRIRGRAVFKSHSEVIGRRFQVTSSQESFWLKHRKHLQNRPGSIFLSLKLRKHAGI